MYNNSIICIMFYSIRHIIICYIYLYHIFIVYYIYIYKLYRIPSIFRRCPLFLAWHHQPARLSRPTTTFFLYSQLHSQFWLVDLFRFFISKISFVIKHNDKTICAESIDLGICEGDCSWLLCVGFIHEVRMNHP